MDLIDTSAKTAPAPVAKRPILERLVPSTVITNIDRERNMPSIGATLEVPVPYCDGEHKTVWLTAQAWEGVMTLIVQTPDRYRASVAEFLEVVHSVLPTGAPLELLLDEIITEVRDDVYADKLPQTPLEAHDFAW